MKYRELRHKSRKELIDIILKKDNQLAELGNSFAEMVKELKKPYPPMGMPSIPYDENAQNYDTYPHEWIYNDSNVMEKYHVLKVRPSKSQLQTKTNQNGKQSDI